MYYIAEKNPHYRIDLGIYRSRFFYEWVGNSAHAFLYVKEKTDSITYQNGAFELKIFFLIICLH